MWISVRYVRDSIPGTKFDGIRQFMGTECIGDHGCCKSNGTWLRIPLVILRGVNSVEGNRKPAMVVRQLPFNEGSAIVPVLCAESTISGLQGCVRSVHHGGRDRVRVRPDGEYYLAILMRVAFLFIRFMRPCPSLF